MIKKLSPIALATSLAIGGMAVPMAASATGGDLSANITVTNNYIWRGLTQTSNETAFQGGIDYAWENGFYVGTWLSNVSYEQDDVDSTSAQEDAQDPFSYEHDLYFGYSGEFGNGVSYDIGYLYYNYDSQANFDFGEVYGSIGIGGFSVSLNVLANTEADEGPGQDFGFGEATYLSLDYTLGLSNDLELTFHFGNHDGDFNNAFNGAGNSYNDYSVSLAKGPFAFTISDTDADEGDPEADFATNPALANQDVRFVISYSMDIDL